MQPALVLGPTHATTKHDSFVGCRMLVVQPIGVDDKADGPPLIVLDGIGARKGDRVFLTSDGTFAREVTGHKQTPARWSVAGLVD